MSKIRTLIRPAPLHKTLPALAGADSVGRIRSAWRAFRAARTRGQRTRLADIPADLRPLLARQYRIGAGAFGLLALVMLACAVVYGSALGATITLIISLSVPAYLYIAVLKLWQAAMIDRGHGLSFREFLSAGAVARD